MTQVPLSSNFEGTAGNVVDATFYDDTRITMVGNGGCQFSTGFHHEGSTSLRFDGTSGAKRFQFLRSTVTDDLQWSAFYRFAAITSATGFFRLLKGGVEVFTLELATSGKIRATAPSAVTVPVDLVVADVTAGCRLHFQYDGTTGTLEMQVFTGADIDNAWDAPTATATFTALVTGGWDEIRFGWIGAVAAFNWIDALLSENQIATPIDPVSTPPIASFVPTPTGGSEPLDVVFTDTSENTPTSWAWDFGDAGTSTSQNPTHTFAAGTFNVALTATNADGSSVSVQPITVEGVSQTPITVKCRKLGVLLDVVPTNLKCRKAGVLMQVGTINGISQVVNPPPPPPPPTGRFAGDPGVGKCYVGCNRADAKPFPGEQEMYDYLTGLLSDRTTTYHGPKVRKGQNVTTFISGSAGDPKGTDTYPWDYDARLNNHYPSLRFAQFAVETGQIPWLEMNISLDLTWLTSVAAGDASKETFYKDNVGAPLQAFGQPIWYIFDHEPEDNPNTLPSKKANDLLLRTAIRQVVRWFREEGYDQLAYATSAFMMMDFHDWGVAAGRDWRLWYPDWKGTSLNGATPLNADPRGNSQDFYTGDPGDVDESVVDVIGVDVYYWNASHNGWSATTDIAHTGAFEPDVFGSEIQLAADAMGFLGKPMAIRELGTQACGYLDSAGTMVERDADIAKTVANFTSLIPHIEAGRLVSVNYFNTGEHGMDVLDPKRAKAQGLATLLDAPVGTTVPRN